MPASTRPDRVLPAALAARARAFASGEHTPSTPRPAATVVLVRDRADGSGIEAYLLRRVTSMAFAAGMYVFPGGTVDRRDLGHDVAWAGEPVQRWARVFATDPAEGGALVCAAVRETFEESGVLLAGPSAGHVVEDTTGAGWEADRQALIDRALGFADMLDRRGLVLRADLLRPWAHWITPVFEERRYDTRFFVAALPSGQRTRDVGGEADRVVWMRPKDAVERHARGEMAMLPPTIATLTELAEFPTVADVLDAGWRREISPTTPRAVLGDREVHVVLPGEPGFEQGLTA